MGLGAIKMGLGAIKMGLMAIKMGLGAITMALGHQKWDSGIKSGTQASKVGLGESHSHPFRYSSSQVTREHELVTLLPCIGIYFSYAFSGWPLTSHKRTVTTAESTVEMVQYGAARQRPRAEVFHPMHRFESNDGSALSECCPAPSPRPPPEIKFALRYNQSFSLELVLQFLVQARELPTKPSSRGRTGFRRPFRVTESRRGRVGSRELARVKRNAVTGIRPTGAGASAVLPAAGPTRYTRETVDGCRSIRRKRSSGLFCISEWVLCVVPAAEGFCHAQVMPAENSVGDQAKRMMLFSHWQAGPGSSGKKNMTTWTRSLVTGIVTPSTSPPYGNRSWPSYAGSWLLVAITRRLVALVGA
ncbi:hypothetical protein GGX14DRAFT_400793 [Mycena pura]|uniref:Uncharacterized protein n=1 Tax=Mycena pura TaxID=153505 RepID=A0AAD6V1Y9_9AGAR|nr:hypothetical protein GGX14DRAFT_400793 [Mycena pura]